MKKVFVFFVFSCLVLTLDASVFTSTLIEVITPVRVDCGDHEASEESQGAFSDTVDVRDFCSPEHVTFNMTKWLATGIYSFTQHHYVTLDGIYGPEHQKPGTKGHVTKVCTYRIVRTLTYEEGSSEGQRHYDYTHTEVYTEVVPCAHRDEP